MSSEGSDNQHKDVVADEDPGDGFLNMDLTGIRYNTHAIKNAVNNVLMHFGGDKPKQRTKEHLQMQINEYLNMIPFAARLTKNEEHDTACPVDVETIRGYDLKGKDYELPPYHVGTNRGNTLHATFIGLCEQAYSTYQEQSEKQFNDECGPSGTYMKTTNWKSKLEPPLAEITRYLIKFWHCHPFSALGEKRTTRRGKQESIDQFAKIKKILDRISSDGTVEVIYTRPGILWQKGVAVRINNIITAITGLATEEPGLVQHCLPVGHDVQDGTKRTFDLKSGRVILAIILHLNASSSDELKSIKLFEWFNEQNFIADLENTQGLWLPPIFAMDIPKLECFYDLILSRHEILGLKKAERVSLLDGYLGNAANITYEKGQQVNEIMHLCYAIVGQLDAGTVLGQKKEVDPWDTQCSIFDDKDTK
jgi:hypothetical protein